VSSHESSSEGWNADSGDMGPGAVSGRSTSHPVTAVDSDIRLTLPARPENVAVVRHAVTDDMRLAVTEACTNVVRHAYHEGEGTIAVVVRPRGDALEVIVADEGAGIGPSPDTGGPGLGLPLIAALADSLEIEQTPRRGSRLIMSFVRHRTTPAMGMACQSRRRTSRSRRDRSSARCCAGW
jgi:serine/threonine-protein kinase RsbW